MTHRTRVLWLIKGLNRGGAERLVSQMAPRFDRSRFDVEVAYVTQDANAFVPDLLARGVRVHCLGGRRNVELGWPRNLRRLLREHPFDIVHAHSPLPAAVARLLAPRGTRHLYTEHNLWGVYRGPTYAANAVTYARNERAFAVSDGVADSIQRPAWASVGRPPPIEVLRHGIDIDAAPHGAKARTDARQLLGLVSDTPVIGNVANFSPKKDQATLLEAFNKVHGTVPDALLLLVGMGPLEDELRAKVSALGLDGTVRFLGSRDDVPRLLPALDVFVLSSTHEGLPISLLEAMAAQVACACTTVGGIPEALRPDVDGKLVPPQDVDALAATLGELLTNRSERSRLAAAGRQRVEASFSLEPAVDRLAREYDAPGAGHRGGKSA
ncbi:MAG: glycosyltransferase [Nitriliruptoraceae bacterium]|nr:glycosyltransferase [Nitriliruptoraceae bacterium]